MRQQTLTVTCDGCGAQQSFETLRIGADGPIVTTRNPTEMLDRNGWVAVDKIGFRNSDLCRDCWAVQRGKRQ